MAVVAMPADGVRVAATVDPLGRSVALVKVRFVSFPRDRVLTPVSRRVDRGGGGKEGRGRLDGRRMKSALPTNTSRSVLSARM